VSETNTALRGIYFALIFLINILRHKRILKKKKNIFHSYSVAILFNIAIYVSYSLKVGSGVQKPGSVRLIEEKHGSKTKRIYLATNCLVDS